ncbi:MAG: 6-phosphogluconolactonase, partial [Parachlamydiaceae bacterium]
MEKRYCMSEIRIHSGFEAAERDAAVEFVKTANEAIKQQDKFTVVLSGGMTPRELYSLLASNEFSAEVDWDKVYFFFGDERDVSPMSDQSNYH